MAHEKDPPGAFRIGIGSEDVEGIAVRVVHIEATRAGLPDESTAESREVIIPKRVVAADFGEVAGNRAELKVLDTVTIGEWQFQVGVEGTFTFVRQPSRWEVEGRETRPDARRAIALPNLRGDSLTHVQGGHAAAYLAAYDAGRGLVRCPFGYLSPSGWG